MLVVVWLLIAAPLAAIYSCGNDGCQADGQIERYGLPSRIAKGANKDWQSEHCTAKSDQSAKYGDRHHQAEHCGFSVVHIFATGRADTTASSLIIRAVASKRYQEWAG